MSSPDESLDRYDLRAIEASVRQWSAEQGEVGAMPQHLHAKWLLLAVAEIRALRGLFDSTRHEILQALGETDWGKGWNHIPGLIGDLRRKVWGLATDLAIAQEQMNQLKVKYDDAWRTVESWQASDARQEARIAELTRERDEARAALDDVKRAGARRVGVD